MQDPNGKTISVGGKVQFTTWDDTDVRNPKPIKNEGVVTALSNQNRENEKFGTVTVKNKDGKSVDLDALAVTVLPEK